MPNGTDRLNALTRLRREQEKTVAFVAAKDELAGQKLNGCATWLHFREWLDHGGETRLMHVNFCRKYTLCRICAARRSVKLVEAYQPKVDSLLAAAAKEERKLVPAVIMLAIKSGPDVAERIEHCKSSWSRMIAAKRKAESNPEKNQPIEWNHVEGCLRSLEATHNPKEGWHIHMHIYALLSSYLDVFALSAEWKRFTGDSCIVYAQKAHGETRSALHEVIKYVCKFSGLTDELLWEFHQGVNGGRMFDPAGTLRGVKTGDTDQDNIDDLTGPYRDWVATWLFMEKKYHLQQGSPTMGMQGAYLQKSH